MKYIIRICLLLSFLAACSASADLTIKVHPDSPHFRISLKSNPTTGYKWNLVNYDEKRFKLVDKAYVAAKKGMIGSGGKQVFTFVSERGAKYPKQTMMEFEYARSWEKEPVKTTKVKVIFQKPSK